MIFWPGVPMYDTVAQYEQVLSGDVDDWHPPIMVRLWQLLLCLAPGSGPMFLLQVGLYLLGFALIIAVLARTGRTGAAIAAACLALSPLILGWQMVVLKDAQMLGSLLAAVGIVAHYRLLGRPMGRAAAAAVIVLIAYATLVRANSLFATVPLALLLLERPRSVLSGAVLAVGLILLLLGVEPLINQRVLKASPTGVAKTQPLFDLAAIAVAAPQSVPPFTLAERRQLIARNCVKSFFWDPVGDPRACGPVTERANELPGRELDFDLARAIASHPIAYVRHRLGHWNSTERWLVRPGLIDAAPPEEAEPNPDGLAGPHISLVPVWQDLAALEAGTPIGWPIFWTALALVAIPAAWRRRGESHGALAFALLVSSLALEASFLVVSIASDLRYHLWPMVAAALGIIILGLTPWRDRPRASLVACAILLLVAGGGILSRSTLEPAPPTYQAMLHAPA